MQNLHAHTILCVSIIPRTDKEEKTYNACFVRLALLKIYFANLIVIVYMCVYMSLCASVCRHPWRSDEEVRFPGLTGSCVVTRLTWVLRLNQGPLQEEQVLTVGPKEVLLFAFLNCLIGSRDI